MSAFEILREVAQELLSELTHARIVFASGAGDGGLTESACEAMRYRINKKLDELIIKVHQ